MLRAVTNVILLLAASALCHERENGIIYKNEALGIRPFNSVYDMKSLDYPERAPHQLVQTWRYVAFSEDNRPKAIKITCSTVNIPQVSGNGCGEYTLELKDGDDVRHFCGPVAPFEMITQGEDVYVTLKTGPRGGALVDCKVKAIYLDHNREEITTTTTTTPKPTRPSYFEMESREFDSSEHGVAMGQKSTTCACGWANKFQEVSRIVNGTETNRNEYPFAVGLAYHGSPQSRFCGATIITKWHALTAAHCTFGQRADTLAIQVGIHVYTEMSGPAVMYQVERMIQHAQYSKKDGWKNDITLLVTKEEIQFSRLIGPACLPNRKLTLDREFIKIIGWGAIYFHGPQSAHLQDVDVRAVPMKECNYAYSTVDYRQPTQICTYANQKGACQGDSGGPVMWVDPETNRYTHVGIVSFGRVCGDRSPTVHTDVSAYLNWIHHYIKATKPQAVTCTKVN